MRTSLATMMVCGSLGCAESATALREHGDAMVGDAPATPDASADATATPDASADGSACVDGAVVGRCHRQTSSMPLCPTAHVAQESTERVSFRMTHLTITAPAALASPLLGNVINGAIHSGGFLWGLRFDLTARTAELGGLTLPCAMRGSVGSGLIDGRYRFFMGDAPASSGPSGRWDRARATITVSDGRVSTSTIAGPLLLPIFGSGGALLTELPLRCAAVTATIPPDGSCIGLGEPAGGTFDECTSAWRTSDGTLSAFITTDDARGVRVESLNTTLCDLLTGSNCASTPASSWTRQPVMSASCGVGYPLTARFSAISARVTN